MKRMWNVAYIIIVLMIFGCPFVFAQDKTNDAFDFGLDIRYRNEYWDNVFDMSDSGANPDDNIIRLKASLWGKWNIQEDVALYMKISGEPWYYLSDRTGDQLIKDELVVDNLYLDLKKPFDWPVDFRIGRQDFLFVFGEGFLIMDGTPFDGSRTFYFNAVKSSWTINENNKIDVVYISNRERDDWFPVLNDFNQRLNTSDEQGLVVYGRNKLNDKLLLEPYYMYKLEEEVSSTTPDLDLHTIGAHAVYNSPPWKLHGELAGQFGEYDDGRDREGFGGYIFADHLWDEAPFCPELSLGLVYLTGDDPDTNKNEDWNPLYSRWPWLSELYILSYVTEKGIPGYWTNLQAYRASLKLCLTEKTNLSLRYNYLRANEDPNITDSIFSNDGKERGHLPQIQLNHQIAKNISTYVLFEYLIPGDFYVDESDDAFFFRWEIQFKF